MTTQHTPGPWFVNGPWNIQADTHTEIPVIVAHITPMRGEWASAREANATLIAAAPDLLAALQRSLNWLSSYPGGLAHNTWEQAHAAIAKAEGR